MNKEPQSKPRRRGRPTVQIVLSDDERQTLERWARRGSSSQALALRYRIVLACAQGLSNVEAGARLGVHAATVGKWRARFAARRLEGLVDEPRPGVTRTITDEQVEEVIVKTLEETPPMPRTGRPGRWRGRPGCRRRRSAGSGGRLGSSRT
jgi:hypothetical protein